MTKSHIVYTTISLRKFLTIFFFSTLFFPSAAFAQSITASPYPCPVADSSTSCNIATITWGGGTHVYIRANDDIPSTRTPLFPPGSSPQVVPPGILTPGTRSPYTFYLYSGDKDTGGVQLATAPLIVNVFTPQCGWYGELSDNSDNNLPIGSYLGTNITYPSYPGGAFVELGLNPDGATQCRRVWDSLSLVTLFSTTGTWFENRTGPLDQNCSGVTCSPPPNGRYVRQFECTAPGGLTRLTNKCIACPPGHTPSGDSCVVVAPPPPTVSIWWAPATVPNGGASTIYWSSSLNATYCDFDMQSDGVPEGNTDAYNAITNPRGGWPPQNNPSVWTYANRTVSETWTMRCWNGTTGPVAAQATLWVAPPPPTNINPACPLATEKAKFSWSPVVGAPTYALRVDNLADGWDGTCSSPGGDFCLDTTGTGYEFTFNAGASYSAWVHAYNAGGWSAAVNTGPSGLVPTSYITRGDSPQDRKVLPGGAYKVYVLATGITENYFCFGNNGTQTYFVPLGSLGEFNSFWNRIETGNPATSLSGLYKILP